MGWHPQRRLLSPSLAWPAALLEGLPTHPSFGNYVLLGKMGGHPFLRGALMRTLGIIQIPRERER